MNPRPHRSCFASPLGHRNDIRRDTAVGTPWPGRGSMMRRLLLLLLAAVTFTHTLQAQDLELTAITAPDSGCALGNSEPVSMRVFNHGPTLAAGTTFQVMYWIDGGSAVNELVTLGNALATNSTLAFTFSTAIDLSAAGEYVFNVALNLGGDINPGNNSITGYRVHSSALSNAGSINASGTGGSGSLTVSGHTGAVVQWEESPDAERWFKLASNSTTQSYAGLTAPTHFRVRVQSGDCAAAVSSAVTRNP